MKILFVAAECAPFAKVGGLGDVVGTLPPVLQQLGHDTRVIIPHHGVINDEEYLVRPCGSFDISWNHNKTHVEIACTEYHSTPFYFVRGWPYFSSYEDFIYHHDEGMNVGRFLFFAAVITQWLRKLKEQEGWIPDIVHVHDWHTSMVPFLLKRTYNDDPVLGSMPVLFSIHNMRYQGWGIGWHLAQADLPIVNHPLLHAMGKVDNSLAIGLAYSTMLSTVSPRYAQEIVSPAGGYGLDGLLHARLSRLIGILNGIDTIRWDPSTSPHIPTHYDVDSFEKRVKNKLVLQKESGLPESEEIPVVGVVMRLVEQKGPAIMMPAVRYMLEHSDVQFILLGTGEYQYENAAWWLGHDFPGKATIYLTFNERLAELIYAGADVFLMPSLFEPCGIGQMIAMRYGALPVVHEVGGLADTVSPEIGFLFADYHPGALGWAMGRALDLYISNPDGWHKRQRLAMRQDYSWETSARRYIEVYDHTITLSHSYAEMARR